jgi:hypothetical protein
MVLELTDPDDVKLVTLARANRSRTQGLEGAAVRDADGRTYSAASVDLPSLHLSALQLAMAMAINSGVAGLESAVIVTETLAISESDASVVRDFAGPGIPIYRADPSGVVLDSVTT